VIRSSILALAMLLVAGGVVAPAGAGTSDGWVSFTPYTNLGIYVPVKVNGHEAMALLYGGPSMIDRAFAASIGVKPNAAGDVSGLTLEVGNLTLKSAGAVANDLQATPYARALGKIIGRPVLFQLGEDLFDRVAVDLDYPHHRVAFRGPENVVKPAGAIAVPLIDLHGERVVPLSINGAAPQQFELELGNVTGPLLVIPSYARAHALLAGRRTSLRLSGRHWETVVTLDHLGFAGVDFSHMPIALVPESELPPVPISGGVGLPLLSKFRLLIDYSHNRLYAIPDAAAVKTPIPKDRIGLVLGKEKVGHNFGVTFVSPHSPAAVAGFRKGDKIALIDGKPFDAWALEEIVKFQLAAAGTTHTFTMADGTVRRVTAADFF
jgi:hypothetical protein